MQVREQWIAYLRKEKASLDAIYAQDVFADWDSYRQREKKAGDCLRLALNLRYGRDDTGLADKFLKRSLSIAERILAERRVHADVVQDEQPSFDRSDVLEVMTLANAIIGNSLDVEALREAASGFVAWALRERWDDQSEDAYLRAIRLLLIASDVSKASELLRVRKRFKWYGEQVEVLRRLAASNDQPIQDARLLGDFDKVFDPLRPCFPTNLKAFTNVSMTRIELGALRDKYFVSLDGTISWDRAIDAVSH